MSLINDALKKAQRQRTGPADAPPMPGGSHGGARGSKGMPTQMLVLAIAGAVVVVVLSVVTTVWFLNRAPAPKPVAPIAAAVVKPAPSAPDPSPVIIAPVIVQSPPPTPGNPTPADPAAASPVTAAPVAAIPGPVAAPVPAVPEPELPLEARIAKYVDNVRVTGIRASGAGSKVLMNDKVYRLGDTVDRVLGLRLVKIQADSLTFADINGALYTKTF